MLVGEGLCKHKSKGSCKNALAIPDSSYRIGHHVVHG